MLDYDMTVSLVRSLSIGLRQQPKDPACLWEQDITTEGMGQCEQ